MFTIPYHALNYTHMYVYIHTHAHTHTCKHTRRNNIGLRHGSVVSCWSGSAYLTTKQRQEYLKRFVLNSSNSLSRDTRFISVTCWTVYAILQKHLSNESMRKIAYKEIIGRVYTKTGNIEEYNNYKEALNLATSEFQKSNFDQNWRVT